MKKILTLLFTCSMLWAQAQTGMIKGVLQDAEKAAVAYANVALYQSADSSLVKIEITNETGLFQLQNIAAGNYYVLITYIGSQDLEKQNIELKADQILDLGVLALQTGAIELEGATVTAQRVMVEIKPDRTVFNVQGTMNSTGDDAMSLMRKAPGVTVDNNDNIIVLGRSGVQVFIDGKRLPLSGDDLSNYLKNIPSDQIDRIDIISNPGAKYEAEGNAGIIDIRLKKDKSHGANGSIQTNFTQGPRRRGNGSFTGNYRNKKVNVFANVGAGQRNSLNKMNFDNYQNNLFMSETNFFDQSRSNFNYRLGTDVFIDNKNTIGFLVSGMRMKGQSLGDNRIEISEEGQAIDSILVANSDAQDSRLNNTINLNYQYEDRKKDRSLNIDLDYGTYGNESTRYLPNQYFNADETTLLTEVINFFETPTDIGIYTFKLDYEDKLFGGKLGVGTKVSKVVSDNTFLSFDEENSIRTQNDTLSNIFKYDETVYAAYANYIRKINDKWGISAGLRAELTDATGDLQAFLPELSEDPVEQNYLKWFPSVGVTYQPNRMNSLAFNYGRRINRPDYNVLNPFNNRLSEISYQKGNPRLQPEIVNNIELGYTYAYRYNLKLAYSKTDGQITRLIAPDGADPRANFITWANLAEQTVWSANLSAPVQISKIWSAYFNASASYINNQADYSQDGGGIVDIQAFSYNFYSQQSFTLPKGFKAEVSGWYSGPGVWGGVFKYQPNWSLNLGLQKRFLNDQLNVRLSANDLFYSSGWRGVSNFNGLRGEGNGNWDSRFVSLSIGYNFGNQNVKSRRRKTGSEAEAGRVGSGN